MSLNITEIISLSISSISVLTLVITLIFIYRQSREMIKQTKTQNIALHFASWQNIMSILFNLGSYLIQNPNLRPYFYENKNLPEEDSNRQAVLLLSIMYLDFFEYLLISEKKMADAWDWSKETWNTWIIDMFKKSCVLRESIEQNSSWYTKELYELYKKSEEIVNKS